MAELNREVLAAKHEFDLTLQRSETEQGNEASARKAANLAVARRRIAEADLDALRAERLSEERLLALAHASFGAAKKEKLRAEAFSTALKSGMELIATAIVSWDADGPDRAPKLVWGGNAPMDKIEPTAPSLQFELALPRRRRGQF